MIDLEKLKHEWKTFTLNVFTLLIGLHEAAIESGADWSPFIPEKYRPYALPVAAVLSLSLRKYTNKC